MLNPNTSPYSQKASGAQRIKFSLAVKTAVPDWLNALGVDHADLRWADVCRYFSSERARARREIRAELIRIMICIKAKANSDDGAWGPTREDVADAELWARRTFGGQARRTDPT